MTPQKKAEYQIKRLKEDFELTYEHVAGNFLDSKEMRSLEYRLGMRQYMLAGLRGALIEAHVENDVSIKGADPSLDARILLTRFYMSEMTRQLVSDLGMKPKQLWTKEAMRPMIKVQREMEKDLRWLLTRILVENPDFFLGMDAYEESAVDYVPSFYK